MIMISPNAFALNNSSYPITITEVGVKNYEDREISSIKPNSPTTLHFQIRNNMPEKQPYMIIIEVRNSAGVTVSLQFQSGTLDAYQSTTIGGLWITGENDSYGIRAFVVSDLYAPEVLSSITGKEFTVSKFAPSTGTYSLQSYIEDNSSDADSLYFEDLIFDHISTADARLSEAFDEFSNGNYDNAKDKAQEAKSEIKDANRIYFENEAVFDEDQAKIIDLSMEIRRDQSNILIQNVDVFKEADDLGYELQNIQTVEDAILILPKLEFFFRGVDELAGDVNNFAIKLELNRERYPDLGITEDFVGYYRDLSQGLEEFAEQGEELIQSIKTEYTDGYVPVENKEIPTEYESTIPEYIVSPQLAAFFESFDSNGDGTIDIGEAQEFYYWVEENIQYRYDDENELDPQVGTVVGDDRAGRDYRQTPNETYQERYGDCEDMATLELAFYNYFNIEAYVVGVNAKSSESIDHAATIVRISDDIETFQDFLGGMVYYELGEGRTDLYGSPVTSGVYMLVDNAYSDTFGYLSGGLEEGTFTMQCMIPLDVGYDDDWYEAVSACSVPMD
jgi:hypothetical protein